ncbi:opioid-binding protein/cell adhesion molecule [Eurytemora carolleeae]|uniref:opioid-binding protein/cell adhesion molecule n=1 Tax=Eurytemora carolleeae TaxID=1294199 RepID=UPI000C7930BD|nr:opioid-binding protein/cell adhesion molecule [Eurytemora carolleeae]|eukprot:XP_023327934.1 opioid-binding protein/cell adhesion molecule-like [Eurytemora affinis]
MWKYYQIFQVGILIQIPGFTGLGVNKSSLQVREESPWIETQSTNYRMEQGGTAVLNCNVRNLGSMIKVWRNGTRVIYVGDIKIRNDPRIYLNTTSLIIQGVTVWDSGWYYCELENDIDNPVTLKHNLQVTEPPAIEDEDERQLTSISGSTISLSCRAAGHPAPNITWSKEGKRSEILGHGPELTLTQIGRLDAGRYKCSASNGVGNPVTKTIHLTVLYFPEIFPSVNKVHGSVGHSVNISCEVWGNPKPDLDWIKTSQHLNFQTSTLQTETGAYLSVLHVFVYNETYLGNYNCTAQNRFGQISKSVLIRGNPDPPQVLSKDVADRKNSYTLIWKSEPQQNISLYQIMNRKLPDGSVVYAWDIVDYPVKENYKEDQHALEITKLESDSAYVTIVKAYNRYGWSDPSQEFIFYTRGKDMVVESPIKEESNMLSSGLIHAQTKLLYIMYIILLLTQ